MTPRQYEDIELGRKALKAFESFAGEYSSADAVERDLAAEYPALPADMREKVVAAVMMISDAMSEARRSLVQ